MSELINRQMAIDAVHINYDEILDFKSTGRTIADSVEDIISNLSSAQPEIISCFECIHYKPMSSSWGKCYVHSSRTERYRTCQSCDYCSWAEKE